MTSPSARRCRRRPTSAGSVCITSSGPGRAGAPAGRALRSHTPPNSTATASVFHALGLGLEQTLQYPDSAASFAPEFEQWIVATAGEVPALQVARIQCGDRGRGLSAAGRCPPSPASPTRPVLAPDDLAFWHEHGYVILRDAVAAETLRGGALMPVSTASAHASTILTTWYGKPQHHGCSISSTRRSTANRRSPRIH